MTPDLAFTPAVRLLALCRARKASPLEVVEAALAQIDRVNPSVNAFVTLAREAALAEARRATARSRRAPPCPRSSASPSASRTSRRRAGIRTTYGSKLFEDHVPDEDALVVARLRAAGAIVLGKTNTPEFAFGPNTVNAVFGATRNPWNLEPDGRRIERRVGGGAGDGDVLDRRRHRPRRIASRAGVVLRRRRLPHHAGADPRHPSVLAWDTYSVEGPMARTVADTALVLSVMAGPDDRAPLSYAVDAREFTRAVRDAVGEGLARSPGRPTSAGWWRSTTRCARCARRAAGAFRSLGARVEAACPDMADVPEIVRLSRALLMVARHADKLSEHRAVLQEGLVENTEQGLALTARELAEGELLRSRQWQRVREFMEGRDLLVTPTMAVPPFPIEHPHIIEVNGRPVGKAMARSFLTYAFSVLGLPAISIPCGFTRGGLPVGLQIVGKRRGEAAVLRAAAAFEAARPWADRIPPAAAPAA